MVFSVVGAMAHLQRRRLRVDFAALRIGKDGSDAIALTSPTSMTGILERHLAREEAITDSPLTAGNQVLLLPGRSMWPGDKWQPVNDARDRRFSGGLSTPDRSALPSKPDSSAVGRRAVPCSACGGGECELLDLAPSPHRLTVQICQFKAD